MKKKKWTDLLTVVCFFALLAFAMLVTILRPKVEWSYYENRPLRTWTPPTIRSLLDDSYRADLENMLQEHAAGRNTLLKVSTWTDLYLLQRPVVNQIISTDGLLLHWLDYSVPDAESITTRAEEMGDRLADLQDVVESSGGEFLYVAVPGQYSYFEDNYPDFLNSRSEQTELTLRAFGAALDARGVSWLDMGAVFDEKGRPKQFYSPTDHHYTMDGAYETYLAIMAELNRKRSEPLYILGEDRITETLPNPYLGSRGRKIFGLWTCGETTDLIYSRTAIPFTRFDNGAAVDASVYALPATPWDQISYTVYMGGDVAETVIDTGREDLPSVLIYGDSFTNITECLMYHSFNEMRSIDLRYYHEMSLADYIRLHSPDIVICIRDYSVLLDPESNGDPF